MFTGIITDIGTIKKLERKAKDIQLAVATSYDTSEVALGASVALNGACLTVVEKSKNLLTFDAAHETLEKTTLGQWQIGTKINLEMAMKAGDEFGGHIVTGHVDGVGKIISREVTGESADFVVSFPPELKKFIAIKGSVVVNGVSLTVNEVKDNKLQVTIIPHTLKHTVFGNLQPNDPVNIEVDILARYVARMLETK